MGKENFFRKLIIKAESNNSIITVFRNLQNWNYDGVKEVLGVSYYQLSNENKNVNVLFNVTNCDYAISINVLPINMNGNETTIYCCGYDYSDNQARDIKSDILFELCKEINDNLPQDEFLYCGIIPANND